jgi:hypothetical protein
LQYTPGITVSLTIVLAAIPHVYVQDSNNKTIVNEIINLCNQYQTICGTQMCSSVAPSVGVDTASCMNALPVVRQFFNNNRTSPSLQLQPGATSSFKKYKSSTYMVQYPSDWTVNETDSLVTFYPPLNSYPSGERSPAVIISENFLEDTVSSYLQDHYDYKTINSNTTARLSGLPAYSLEFSYRNTDDNSTYRELELCTIMSGGAM